jgi:hypothetical protein
MSVTILVGWLTPQAGLSKEIKVMNAGFLVWKWLLCIALLAAIAGCEATSPDREVRMARGYVYYCDGAGGGGIVNWSGGLRQGLIDGGYPGAGEVFGWNTGLGVVADQNASVGYKRGKARQMAGKAAEYSRKHPGAPVTFIGLSAGTSIVVFALEEMPGGARVTDAVLCAPSISSTYDLTRALRNLDGEMYVLTSEKDAVLGFLVPMAGTADRKGGEVASAGLRGFRMPSSASPETPQQYAKIVTVPWRPEFAQFGYTGGHTDVLSSRFVAAYIAPRLVERVGAAPPALASREGKVRNPDYERWAKFGVGSYAVMEGYQEYRGTRTAVRLVVTLQSKSADRILAEREFYVSEQVAAPPTEVHSLIAEAWIDPSYHPTTDPRSKIADLPAKRVTVKGQTFTCSGRSIDAAESYPDWGSDLTATAYRCPDLPGGVVEIELESHFEREPFTFEGRMVDFKIVSD